MTQLLLQLNLLKMQDTSAGKLLLGAMVLDAFYMKDKTIVATES